jgi:hypothetical protein
MHRESDGKFSPSAFTEHIKFFDVDLGEKVRTPTFKPLSGDVNWKVYGGTFISKKYSNGEFDYWLVLEVNSEGESDGNYYYVSLYSVSPAEAGEENLKAALESMGADHLSEEAQTDMLKVDALVSYGVRATLYHAEGSNLRKLMKAARVQAKGAEIMYGFYMDQPQNQIGATGWDVQRGNLWGNLMGKLSK